MIKVGIVGAAGYTAGELLRLLIWHPQVELVSLQSKSHSGELISNAHPDLLGEINLEFSKKLNYNVDVIFLCSGHGKSVAFIENSKLLHSVKIIDLSADFRISEEAHDFVYGLPELNKDIIASSSNIANPGCFATAIELAFLPLAQKGLLQAELNVTAITGSTGAGQNPTATSHFSWKNNNVSVYKAFNHQHLVEIEQSLFRNGNEKQEISFVPLRGNFSRGILATCITNSDLTIDELNALYKSYYKNHPFVIISNENPDVASSKYQ